MAVQDAAAPNADAELIALRPEYHRLRAQYDAFNDNDEDWTDDADLGKPFDQLCMRIVAMPPATTAEGRAFTAIAAMDQMVYVGAGETVTEQDGTGLYAPWQVLKELVGGAFPLAGRRA